MQATSSMGVNKITTLMQEYTHTFIKSTFVSLFHFILFVSDAIGGAGASATTTAKLSKSFDEASPFPSLSSCVCVCVCMCFCIAFYIRLPSLLDRIFVVLQCGDGWDICCLVEWMIFPILWPLLKTKMNIHACSHGTGRA